MVIVIFYKQGHFIINIVADLESFQNSFGNLYTLKTVKFKVVIAVFIRRFGLRLCNIVKQKCKADIVLFRCNGNGFYDMSVNIINMPFADLLTIKSRHKFGNNYTDNLLIFKQNRFGVIAHKEFYKLYINTLNGYVFEKFHIFKNGS